VAAQTPTSGEDADTGDYERSWLAANALLKAGYSWSGSERQCGFLNVPGQAMAPVASTIGFDGKDDGRGLAVTDWDGDGDLDIWMSARTGPAVRFFRNETPEDARRSVLLRLEGRASNRDAIGARVEVTLASGTRRIRSLRAGEGFLSQSTKRLFFGFGPDESPVGLTIHWPSGRVDWFSEIAVGEEYYCIEGSDTLESFPLTGTRGKAWQSTQLEIAKDSASARVVTPSRLLLPRSELESFEGTKAPKFALGERFSLVSLWASWCGNCQAELESWSENVAEFEKRGGRVIAISTDRLEGNPADSERSARRFAGRMADTIEFYWASQRYVDQLQVFHRTLTLTGQSLPLPSTFLVDDRGRVVVYYRGPTTLDGLLRDVDLIATSTATDLALALPALESEREPLFSSLDPMTFARNLYEAGMGESAVDYAQDLLKLNENVHSSRRAENWYFQANIYYQLGAIRESRHAYLRALENEPTRWKAARNAGRLSMRLGEWEVAAHAFLQAADYAPEDADLYMEWAQAAFRAGDYSQARVAVQKVLALDPNHPAAMAALRDISRARTGPSSSK